MIIENPFITKGYCGPQYFCDRETETEKLVSAVRNGRDITLMAPRRYGKTGLIHHLFHAIGDECETLYIDIFNVSDLTEFVKVFSSAVVGRFSTKAEKAGRGLVEFFRNLRLTMTPQSDGMPKFSFDIAPSQAEATLQETFEFIKSRKTVPVIAIDEFQQVRAFPEKGVEALLRSHIQFCHNARFIFAGSKRHLMEEMFVLPRGPFYQSTQLMSLAPIDREKYAAFAGDFFKRGKRPFNAEAFRHLYARFEGVTWYVQAVLNRAWDSPGGLSGVEAVDAAIDTLVEENALTYHDLLASQTAAAQGVLRAIALEGCATQVSSRRFTEKHSLPAGSTVRYAVADLVKRDLLYRSPAGYQVYDRIFANWLSRMN